MPSFMEAMPVSQNRKRPSPPLSCTSNDFHAGPTGSKLRRPESPRKRPRPRSSGLLSHDSVKDLRSHRVFSPSSELSWDMVNQKLGFEFGFLESEETETKQNAKSDLGFASEDLGFDNGTTVSEGIGVSIEKCEKPSTGNGQEAGHDSKTKSFIRPCVRQKVFKAPGSVSYKRLLPYLLNISETNSRGTGIDRCPQLDKGLKDKKCSATEPVRCDDASKGVNEGKALTECQHGNSNTMQEIATDSAHKPFDVYKRNSTSSKTVALLPSITESDMCSSQPLVNGHIQKSDTDLSPQNLMSNNSDIRMPIAAEDSVIVKDNATLVASDENKLDNYVALGKTDDGLPSKLGETDDGLNGNVQEEVIANTNFSYTANGSDLVKNDELAKHSEDARQPVKLHPFEGQKETETKDHKGRDDGDVANQVDDLNEESNQMTPPDAEIFVRPEEGSESDTGDYVILNTDNNVNGKTSNGVNQGIASLDYNTRHDTNSKCRGVLKPRSRMKLFRSPGSFSYRRMLPFLMDIAKDNCDVMATSQLEKPLEKDLGQTEPHASGNLEIPLDKSNTEFEENQENVSVAKPMLILTNGPTTDHENLISVVNGTESQMPANAETEELLQGKEVVSESQTVLEISSSILTSVESLQDKSQPVSLLRSSNSTSNSIEERATSKSNEVISEADRGSSRPAIGFDRVKSVAAHDPLSQHDRPVSSRIPAGGPKRGILKRNPRGCRGLCTCLNCASFRLHAERAFEFSRNQMEDTEELVLGLVDELSHLRNVLENSADSVHDHHVNQLKEACKKASEAEELAKKRLGHMNYDVGVHCRIACTERPRVKFANHVEQHLIAKPEANFLNDQVLKEERDIVQRE